MDPRRMSDLADLDAGELLARFRAGDARPSDAVAACLARLDEREPVVKAFRTRMRRVGTCRGGASPMQRGTTAAPARSKACRSASRTSSTPPACSRRWAPPRPATARRSRTRPWSSDCSTPAASSSERPPCRSSRSATPARTTSPPTRGTRRVGRVALRPARVSHSPRARSRSRSAPTRAVRSASLVVLRRVRDQADVRARPRDGVAQASWTLDHTGPMARSADDPRARLRRTRSVVRR